MEAFDAMPSTLHPDFEPTPLACSGAFRPPDTGFVVPRSNARERGDSALQSPSSDATDEMDAPSSPEAVKIGEYGETIFVLLAHCENVACPTPTEGRARKHVDSLAASPDTR